MSHQRATVDLVSQWMSSNLSSLNHSKNSFSSLIFLFNFTKSSTPFSQVPMPSIYNAIITPTSETQLGVIFDYTLSMSDHISSVSKSSFLSIRDLRRIRNTLDHTTARTIATSLIHSQLNYCNSLFLNLPQSKSKSSSAHSQLFRSSSR